MQLIATFEVVIPSGLQQKLLLATTWLLYQVDIDLIQRPPLGATSNPVTEISRKTQCRLTVFHFYYELYFGINCRVFIQMHFSILGLGLVNRLWDPTITAILLTYYQNLKLTCTILMQAHSENGNRMMMNRNDRHSRRVPQQDSTKVLSPELLAASYAVSGRSASIFVNFYVRVLCIWDPKVCLKIITMYKVYVKFRQEIV